MTSTCKLARTIAGAAFTLASAAPSCSGRVADLGNNGSGSGPVFAGSPTPMQGAAGAPAATTPWKLVDREFQVGAFAVDAGQIFWTAATFAQGSGGPPPTPPAFLRTCTVANCASSVVSWPLASLPGIIRTSADSVFWQTGGIGEGLQVCPKADCTAPRSLVSGVTVQDFVVANQSIFLVSQLPGIVLRCMQSDCDRTLTRFAMRAPDGEDAFSTPKRIVADDTFLYMLLGDGRIVRIRNDDTGTFEVIARDQINASDLVQQGDSIFWTESVILGHVFRCPKTGCAGSPEVVAEGLHAPTFLALDASNAYFTEPPDVTSTSDVDGISGSNRISRCALPACRVPTLLFEKVGYPVLIGVDDHFIYFSGFHCRDVSGFDSFSQPCAFVATIPK